MWNGTFVVHDGVCVTKFPNCKKGPSHQLWQTCIYKVSLSFHKIFKYFMPTLPDLWLRECAVTNVRQAVRITRSLLCVYSLQMVSLYKWNVNLFSFFCTVCSIIVHLLCYSPFHYCLRIMLVILYIYRILAHHHHHHFHFSSPVITHYFHPSRYSNCTNDVKIDGLGLLEKNVLCAFPIWISRYSCSVRDKFQDDKMCTCSCSSESVPTRKC